MILSVVLLVSAAVGGYILATDSSLWSVAPTHAYGLAAFTVIDLALIVGQWRMPRTAIIVTVLLGLVQLGAMSGDVFFGASTLPSNVTTTAAFSKYLLGDAAFVTLLGIQIVLIVVGIVAFMMSRKTSARANRLGSPVPSIAFMCTPLQAQGTWTPLVSARWLTALNRC